MRRRIGGVIGDTALALLAVAGAACIALVIAALAFNVSIMLFSTGSMGPTIPAGSAALVREIPASEVRLGDVVTVDRPGRLPVTHRVVGIAEAAGGDDRRSLTLRGDANPVDDPAPYDVAAVRLVLWSVPGAAPVIAWLGEPLVLGCLTLAMSALVLWAFWPRAPRARRDPGGPRSPSAAGGDRTRTRRASRAAGGAAAALAATAVLASPAPPAEAAPVEQTTQGRYIQLTTISDPALMTSLEPGGTAELLLGVRTVEEAPGVVAMSFDVDADAGGPLRLRVTACARAATGGSCDDARVLIPDLALDGAAAAIPLGEIPGHPGAWYRFEVSLPAADPVQGSRARLTIRASGFGEIVEAPGEGAGSAGPLAESGWDAPARAALAAAVVAIGLVLARLAGAHRRRGGPT